MTDVKGTAGEKLFPSAQDGVRAHSNRQALESRTTSGHVHGNCRPDLLDLPYRLLSDHSGYLQDRKETVRKRDLFSKYQESLFQISILYNESGSTATTPDSKYCIRKHRPFAGRGRIYLTNIRSGLSFLQNSLDRLDRLGDAIQLLDEDVLPAMFQIL